VTGGGTGNISSVTSAGESFTKSAELLILFPFSGAAWSNNRLPVSDLVNILAAT
jgi:hypothetical protein